MKMTTEDLIAFVDQQFSYQAPVRSLWQTLADNFYPERADFTTTRNVGSELADSLLSSYPVLVRRDLANSFHAMLRDGDWFKIATNNEVDHAGQMWLDWASKRLRRVMYQREAGFVRATKEGDHDYATFGQAVISVEHNRNYNGLQYRAWHLRDCAWWENETGQVCGVAIKWKPTRRQLIDYFGPDKLHHNVTKEIHLPKNQMMEHEVYRVVMPSSQYGEDTERPYVSFYVDPQNQHVIEKVAVDNKIFAVPRFQTIAGSAYAYSPATVAGLPDARMLQAMTHTLMEAGERYARPPLIGTAKAVKSNIDLGPNGITWVDSEYDEKMGEALRTLKQDRGGFPIGLELRDGIIEVLSSAFYINKISLPETNRDMTAYEIQERMKQYRRENLPLFAPMEEEYNGQLCEMSFDLAFGMGMLGSPQDVPESLRGQDVRFEFVSPLSRGDEEQKAAQFRQVSQMLAEAVQVRPGVEHNLDFDEALRDAITGVGAPEKWLNSVEDVLAMRQQQAMMQMQAGQDAA